MQVVHPGISSWLVNTAHVRTVWIEHCWNLLWEISQKRTYFDLRCFSRSNAKEGQRKRGVKWIGLLHFPPLFVSCEIFGSNRKDAMWTQGRSLQVFIDWTGNQRLPMREFPWGINWQIWRLWKVWLGIAAHMTEQLRKTTSISCRERSKMGLRWTCGMSCKMGIVRPRYMGWGGRVSILKQHFRSLRESGHVQHLWRSGNWTIV